MNIRINALTLFLGFLLLHSGCLSGPSRNLPPAPLFSEAPLPTRFPLTTQEKIQGVHHWDLIAAHTAGLVKKELETTYSKRVRSIYVPPSGVTPFEKVFRTLLITHLFKKGLSVSSDPTDNLILSFDIALVKHPARLIGIDSRSYNALGPGLIVKTTSCDNAGTEGHFFTLPENEIILTSSLRQNGSYVMRNSSIYYIDTPEWRQYVQKIDITSPTQTNYILTDR